MKHGFVTAALAAALVLGPAFAGPQPGDAQTDQVIHVGASSFEANAGAYYALENGFFKQVGLNVDVQPYNNGAAIAAAVAGGSLQIGVGNPLPLAIARERGLNFVIMAPGFLYDAATAPPNCVVAPNSPIHSAKDLEGTTIAVTGLQSLDPLGLLSWIDKNGGDSHKVKLIELPQTLMADAVADGRVAAAVMADPALTAGITSGKVRGLSRCYSALGDHFFVAAWFSTRDWADKNPDVVRRFRIAIDRAGAWATRNPEAAAAVLRKYLRLNEERVHEVHARSLDPAFVQPVIDAAVKYKVLDHPLDAREIMWFGPSSPGS
jgi:NitT/TauT family transport system substrate-binding protein